MLIQCHSCRAKYRLNLEKIPNRKTFIKCRQCGTPIYIDPEGEPPAQAGAPASQPRAATVQVSCGNCGARYQVAAASLKKVGLKLKCSACGHKFPVPEEAARPEEPATPEAPAEVAPPAGMEGGQDAMPLPGAARLASLFDDLQVQPPLGGEETRHFTPADGQNLFGQATPAPAGGTSDPDAAFREAVSLGDPGNVPSSPPDKGKIPDDQKYRFFMKPKDPDSPQEQTENVAEPDLAHPDELPPHDHDPGPPQPPPGAETPAARLGLDPPPPQGHALPPATALPPGTALPPATVDELIRRANEPHGPNPPVDKQIIFDRLHQRMFLAGAALVVLVLGLSGFWGFWVFAHPAARETFAIVPGQVADLTATVTRKGYFVTNQPSGERLYVLTGELGNKFQSADQVGWVRLEGTAFGAGNRTLRKGHGYAGNLLQDHQLKSWEMAAIRAYYGYANGRNDINYGIAKGKQVPFQIVLPGIEGAVVSEKVEVKSFTRRGRGVYLKLFP